MADLATHRTAPWPALLAPHRRHAVDQRQELRDVVAAPARQRHPQWMPCASVRTWCFEPRRARSTGLGPTERPVPTAPPIGDHADVQDFNDLL